MKISRTPLRISFFGGGSDYPQWYNQHGGQVLGASINKYCYVMLHDGKSWFTYDLPNKSGLGSSSAYTIGLLRVCCDFDNVTLSRLATTWEQDKMNGAVGSQDQFICAVGGYHHLKFSEQGIRDIRLPMDMVRPLESYLMLFDTHQYRMNRDVIPQQLARVNQNEKALNEMVKMVDVAVNCLKSQDYMGFGGLLDVAWQLKKSLADSVSTPVIDDIYKAALSAGAIGGKLLGGGGGGFMVFFVEPERQDDVKKALPDCTNVPFHFENEGSRVIYRD